MSTQQMEYLKSRLGIDKKPVTAISLSRTWMIPAKEASEYMLQFYNGHKDDAAFKNIKVKYSVCGKQKIEKNKRCSDVLIKIVDKDELDKTIKGFYSDVISCQIYSINVNESNELKLSNVISASKIGSEWKYSDENMSKCGIVRTTTNGAIDFRENSEPKQTPRPNESVFTRTSTENTENNKQLKNEKIEPSESKSSVYVSRKTNASSSLAKEPKKPVYVSRKRQNEHYSAKDKGVKSVEPPVKKAKSASNKKIDDEKDELQKMFEDGFSDDDFDDGVVMDTNDKANEPFEYKYDDIDVADDEENTNSKSETKLEKTSDTDIKNKSKDDDLFTAATDKQSEVDLKQKDLDKEPVPEVETYVDADGYVVRKVNRKTPASTPKFSNTPAKRSFSIETKTGNKSNTAKKQSNLMSFFKKK